MRASEKSIKPNVCGVCGRLARPGPDAKVYSEPGIRVRAPLAAWILVFIARSVFACSCATDVPKRTFQRATAVFVGRVIAVDPRGPARVEVIEAFKGTRGGQTLELDYFFDSMCQYGIGEPGSEHLIYATPRPEVGTLSTSQCSRSSRLENAGCDLRYLRARAWWWRIPLSRVRLWTRDYVAPCAQ